MKQPHTWLHPACPATANLQSLADIAQAACWRAALAAKSRHRLWRCASSTRLSFSPIRRSPVMILTMYLASSGCTCDSKSRTSCAFAAGPRAAAIARKLRSHIQDGQIPHLSSRQYSCRHRAEISQLAVRRRQLPPRSSPKVLRRSCHSNDPPTCSVVSSHTGNGLPDRKTAATRRFLHRARLQVFRDQTRLFQFLRGSGDALADSANLCITVYCFRYLHPCCHAFRIDRKPQLSVIPLLVATSTQERSSNQHALSARHGGVFSLRFSFCPLLKAARKPWSAAKPCSKAL